MSTKYTIGIECRGDWARTYQVSVDYYSDGTVIDLEQMIREELKLAIERKPWDATQDRIRVEVQKSIQKRFPQVSIKTRVELMDTTCLTDWMYK